MNQSKASGPSPGDIRAIKKLYKESSTGLDTSPPAIDFIAKVNMENTIYGIPNLFNLSENIFLQVMLLRIFVK